jgi:hypothetical protein
MVMNCMDLGGVQELQSGGVRGLKSDNLTPSAIKNNGSNGLHTNQIKYLLLIAGPRVIK